MITRRRLAAGWTAAALAFAACTGGAATSPSVSPSSAASQPAASEPAASGSAADICTAPPKQDGVTMTFTSFGGVYQEAQRKGWLEPYAALTAASAAISMSASGSTTRWFLAPPRAWTRFPWRVPVS